MSPKEQLVLRILMDNPKGLYGSQFVQLSEGKLSRGTIYVLLDRLVEKGYVREEEQPPTSEYQIARTRHFLAAAGQKAYKSFMADHGLQLVPGVFAG